jgi:hypothetical protein
MVGETIVGTLVQRDQNLLLFWVKSKILLIKLDGQKHFKKRVYKV